MLAISFQVRRRLSLAQLRFTKQRWVSELACSLFPFFQRVTKNFQRVTCRKSQQRQTDRQTDRKRDRNRQTETNRQRQERQRDGPYCFN